jgi:hypothetical protein
LLLLLQVNHMLYCFLYSPQCDLFNTTISPDDYDALSKFSGLGHRILLTGISNLLLSVSIPAAEAYYCAKAFNTQQAALSVIHQSG